jgi:starvation-inducible outer membrane lipoprotein
MKLILIISIAFILTGCSTTHIVDPHSHEIITIQLATF